MPEFTYNCRHCGDFSVWKAMTDLHPWNCPTCSSRDIKRVFVAPAVFIK